MNLSSEGGAQEILREVLAMAAEERAEAQETAEEVAVRFLKAHLQLWRGGGE